MDCLLTELGIQPPCKWASKLNEPCSHIFLQRHRLEQTGTLITKPLSHFLEPTSSVKGWIDHTRYWRHPIPIHRHPGEVQITTTLAHPGSYRWQILMTTCWGLRSTKERAQWLQTSQTTRVSECGDSLCKNWSDRVGKLRTSRVRVGTAWSSTGRQSGRIGLLGCGLAI